VNPFSYNYSRFHFQNNPGNSLYRALRLHFNPDRVEYLNHSDQHHENNTAYFLSDELVWIPFSEPVDKISTAFADLVIVYGATLPDVSRIDWHRILNTNAIISLVQERNYPPEQDIFQYFKTNGFRDEGTCPAPPNRMLYSFRLHRVICCGN